MTPATPAVAVIGEALIDLAEEGDDDPRLARPGGSPYNVSIGLARLGQHAAFVGRLSRDPLGRLLRTHAERSGVDLGLTVDAPEPSTVALVFLDDQGRAEYRFGIDGTADFLFTADELGRIPDDVPAVHFGSLTSWLGPGDAAVAQRIAQLRAAGAAVSYDPNVRPQLQPDRDAARSRIEAAAHLAHVVKASEDDLAYLCPGEDRATVAHRWLAGGAELVVITRGGDGCAAFTRNGSVGSAARHLPVVDTVGAGDAFMAGLLDALLRRDLLSPAALGTLDAATLGTVLDDAGLVAAITCTRAGANPPRRADVDAYPQSEGAGQGVL